MLSSWRWARRSARGRPARPGAGRSRCPPWRSREGSAAAREHPEDDRSRPRFARSVPRSRRGCRAASRSRRFRACSTSLDHALVVARLVRGMELRPHLPAAGLVGLVRPCSRPRAPSYRPPPRRLSGSFPVRRTRASLRRVDGVAVDLESRPSAQDDVQLLDALVLRVLGHEPIARLRGRPRVRPERGDPQMMADRAHVRVLPIGNVLQLIDCRNAIAHRVSTPSRPRDGRRRPVECFPSTSIEIRSSTIPSRGAT